MVPAPRLEETWARKSLVLEGGSFRIVYPEGYADDAKTMLDWCQQATAKLLKHFPDALTTITEKITVYLHEPDGVQHGMAHAEMNPPSMRFVLPSLSARESRTYDAIWYQGNVGHEFTHILYDRYRLRAVGFGRYDLRFDTPRWFDEGLGEYFRLLIIGEEAFTRNYSTKYAPEAEKLIRDGLAGIQDVYAAGAWALRFLHNRYGLPTIRNIMRSPQEAFWNAVKEQTGLSTSEFEKALQQWLRER
jgi:hypothetical protein